MLRRKVFKALFVFLLINSSCISVSLAEDAMSLAHSAVSEILFEYDDVTEYVTFSVGEDGFVDIIFPGNMPDPLYLEILTTLEQHKDIRGVLPGKGGATCPLW